MLVPVRVSSVLQDLLHDVAVSGSFRGCTLLQAVGSVSAVFVLRRCRRPFRRDCVWSWCLVWYVVGRSSPPSPGQVGQLPPRTVAGFVTYHSIHEGYPRLTSLSFECC